MTDDSSPKMPAFLVNLEKLFAAGMSVKEVVRKEASAHLTKLKIVNNFAGRVLMKGRLKSEFNSFAADIDRGAYDKQIREFSRKMQALTKAEIKEALAEKLNIATDPASAARRTADIQKHLKDISEDEYVGILTAFHAVLPDHVREVHDAAILQGGRTVEGEARRFYKMSADEKAKYQLEMAQKLPIDALVEATYEVAQKATLARLKAVVKSAMAKQSFSDMWPIICQTMNVAQDVMNSVTSRKGLLTVSDKKEAAALGKSLRSIFNLLEKEAIASGMTPDTDVGQAIKDAFKAAANDNPPQPGQPPRFGTGGPKV